MILWMIFFVKISDAMHFSESMKDFCLLWISIWNLECTLSYTLAVILAMANDFEQRGQFHRFVLHAQYLSMAQHGHRRRNHWNCASCPSHWYFQPKILPEKPWGQWDCPVCSVGISCMYHHYIATVPKPLMQVVVAASWELLGYAIGRSHGRWEFGGLKKPKKKPQ